MDETRLYKLEDERLKEYELISKRNITENKTDLGYRTLNTRFLKMEEKSLNKSDLQIKKEAHEQLKKNLEAAWQTNTAQKVAELETQAGHHISNKKKAYYERFSLQEMEAFIKNSERGGNSNEYNDVATDLELYNRVMTSSTDSNEGLTLLFRIQESCKEYLRTHKHPFSGTGRIRKAIIGAISDKVKAKLDQAQDEIKTSVQDTYTAFSKDRNDDPNGEIDETRQEHIEAAIKAHFDLIYHCLTGNMKLNKEQLADLDKHMMELLEASKGYKVDANQNNTVSTRFFNALGWSSHKPKLVTEIDLEDDNEELKHSPVKTRMYHTINTLTGQPNAIPLAKQLLGIGDTNNRHFLSDGMSGKGTYLAAPNNIEMERATSNHCWGYGTADGSVQLVMCLNQHAKIIRESEIISLSEEKLKKLFPNLFSYVSDQDRSRRVGRNYLTIFAAMFGYNTIRVNNSQVKGVDYYVTCDRETLSISSTVELRRKYEDNNATWDADKDEIYHKYTNPYLWDD